MDCETYAAIGNPVRFKIVNYLLNNPRSTVGTIISVAGQDISAQAISAHLRVLKNTNLVDRLDNWKFRRYSLRPEFAEWFRRAQRKEGE